MTDDETDWPDGWTARERIKTVALDRREFDAEEAGVDVETARRVLNEMTEDYSDTRWGDDD